MLGWALGKGARRASLTEVRNRKGAESGLGARRVLLEGLSGALGLLKMNLLQKPTLWSSPSHCESPESHSPMSEENVIIIIGKTFRLAFLR